MAPVLLQQLPLLLVSLNPMEVHLSPGALSLCLAPHPPVPLSSLPRPHCLVLCMRSSAPLAAFPPTCRSFPTCPLQHVQIFPQLPPLLHPLTPPPPPSHTQIFPNVPAPAGRDQSAFSECAQKSLAVKPRRGDAVLFHSIKPNGELERRSMHGACPVIKVRARQLEAGGGGLGWVVWVGPACPAP